MKTPQQVSRAVTWVAAIVALLVTVVPPLGYFGLARERLASHLDTVAENLARRVEVIIEERPTTWPAEALRIQALIQSGAFEPAPYRVDVIDGSGNPVATVGTAVPWPVLTGRVGLYDYGEVTGWLSVRRSYRPLLWGTALAALGGLVLGLLVFVPMRRIPLNAMHAAFAELALEKESAEVKLYSIRDGLITTDAADRIDYLNPAAARLIGMPPDEARGRAVGEVFLTVAESEGAREVPCDEVQEARSTDRPCWLVQRGGERIPVEYSVAPIRDSGGMPRGKVVAFHDVTQRREYEARLLRQANYDALTGLANRVLSMDRLRQAMARSQRDGTRVVVMFVDLDRFKTINDTLGHAAGDRLLEEAASRLVDKVRQVDTVARLGGDEFLIIQPDFADALSSDSTAQKVLECLGRPFRIDGRELFVSGSVGIAIYPDDGLQPEELLRKADCAMYRAKNDGRNTFRYYTPEMNEEAQRRLELETQLHHAIDHGELLLHYQPMVGAQTGELVAVEALLRWSHPSLGDVPPEQAMAVAEDTGLVLRIGEWVLTEACRQARVWQARSARAPRVSVNLSARQFRGAGLPESVSRALAAGGLEANRLELEIPERLLLSDAPEVAPQLESLGSIGVHLAIDGFGTGYSALGYLKRFRFETLKIDRSYVQDIAVGPEDTVLLQAIIAMAHALDLKVVGEGVEDEQAAEVLRLDGCDILQGFHFAEPLSAEELEARYLDRLEAGGPAGD